MEIQLRKESNQKDRTVLTQNSKDQSKIDSVKQLSQKLYSVY